MQNADYEIRRMPKWYNRDGDGKEGWQSGNKKGASRAPVFHREKSN
jgi:hypothetical protein